MKTWGGAGAHAPGAHGSYAYDLIWYKKSQHKEANTIHQSQNLAGSRHTVNFKVYYKLSAVLDVL